MELKNFPFQTIDWSSIPAEEHKGETGVAYWKVQMMNEIRGHIIYCVEGSMSTELADGRIMDLLAGMCYFVGDNNEAHRTSTEKGCKLFIVD